MGVGGRSLTVRREDAGFWGTANGSPMLALMKIWKNCSNTDFHRAFGDPTDGSPKFHRRVNKGCVPYDVKIGRGFRQRRLSGQSSGGDAEKKVCFAPSARHWPIRHLISQIEHLWRSRPQRVLLEDEQSQLSQASGRGVESGGRQDARSKAEARAARTWTGT